MRDLRGRNALLTGAAGGLGGYIARGLAAQGVNLALSDLPSSGVADLQAEVEAAGVKVEWIPADVTDTAGLEALVDHAEDALGPLDILVNNAGVEFGGSFGVQTREELETIVSVNLLAPIELIRVTLPRMLDRGRGHIVNMASLAGKTAVPYLASYAATKHALVGLTHSLRAEYGDEPVGFSAVCPVFISRVGMYGRVEDRMDDAVVPFGLETMPPEAVADTVARVIRENRAEAFVTRRPAKPLALLNAVAPQTAIRVMRSRRITDFARRFAAARGRL